MKVLLAEPLLVSGFNLFALAYVEADKAILCVLDFNDNRSHVIIDTVENITLLVDHIHEPPVIYSLIGLSVH